MEPNEREMTAVMALSKVERYRYFIKKSVGWGGVWALEDEGWGTTEDESGEVYFALWPSRCYAAHEAKGSWSGFTPVWIDIDELRTDLLPNLEQNGLGVSVFHLAEHDGGACIAASGLDNDLRIELLKYSSK